MKAKENIAIKKSYIGVGEAKARYITPKPQRLRIIITLNLKIINSKNKTKVLGKCNMREKSNISLHKNILTNQCQKNKLSFTHPEEEIIWLGTWQKKTANG